MGATMVKGPTARPLISTMPIDALRIFENGVSRIRRRRCSRTNPRKNRYMPAAKPSAHQTTNPPGLGVDVDVKESITDGIHGPRRTRAGPLGQGSGQEADAAAEKDQLGLRW